MVLDLLTDAFIRNEFAMNSMYFAAYVYFVLHHFV